MRFGESYRITHPVELHGKGGERIHIADITLADDRTIEDFANAAYRSAHLSLKRLMVPYWRIVVIAGDGRENGFGLSKLVKLTLPKPDKYRGQK